MQRTFSLTGFYFVTDYICLSKWYGIDYHPFISYTPVFYSFCDLPRLPHCNLAWDTDPVNFKGINTHLVRVIDSDLESTEDLSLGWMLKH